MMVNYTFVSQQNPDGRSRRPRSRKACGECRFRKRKCPHQRRAINPNRTPRAESPHYSENCNGQVRDDQPRSIQSPPTRQLCDDSNLGSSSVTRTNTDRPSGTSVSPSRRETIGAHNLLSPVNRPKSSGQIEVNGQPSESSPRFVGDLNPEARLIDGAGSPREAQGISPDAVGVWVQPRACTNTSPSDNAAYTPTTSNIASRPSQTSAPISDLVRTDDLLALSNLYFANIHPILPILNENDYRNALTRSTLPTALAHVVCLMAAKDSEAGLHLRLITSGDKVVPVRSFCTQLHKSITSAIANRSSLKKLTLIRILGLLSMHHEGYDGAEQASGYIAQAIHHAQTLALHLQRPNDEDCELKKTFWSLWTLDRLNAATNSRPCILNDIDISVEPLSPSQSGSVAFDIWFRISKILSSVIGLYRPTNPDSITGIEFEYPGFEQLVDETNGWNLSSSTLATLRIYFLATAILAHRLRTIQTLPTSTAPRLRQQLSAIQIIRFMQDPARLSSLHPIPVVVYGASLALSVSYQQFRYSRLTLEQEEARQDFDTACNILQTLQQKWSAADPMASLAHRVSVELGKLPNLALLRVDRGELENQETQPTSNPPQGQASATENMDWSRRIPDPGGLDTLTDKQGFNWKPENFDLLEGMDDMAWMYLDAENPISFDNLPFIDFGTEYMDQQVL